MSLTEKLLPYRAAVRHNKAVRTGVLSAMVCAASISYFFTPYEGKDSLRDSAVFEVELMSGLAATVLLGATGCGKQTRREYLYARHLIAKRGTVSPRIQARYEDWHCGASGVYGALVDAGLKNDAVPELERSVSVALSGCRYRGF